MKSQTSFETLNSAWPSNSSFMARRIPQRTSARAQAIAVNRTPAIIPPTNGRDRRKMSRFFRAEMATGSTVMPMAMIPI